MHRSYLPRYLVLYENIKKSEVLLIPNLLNDRPDLAGFWRAMVVSYCSFL